MNKKRQITFLLHAVIASFGAYFCMYAFRKPFSVATFADYSFWSIDYKILLIIAQVIGYVTSKFIGIKFIAELNKEKRAFYLVGLIALAEIALLFFGLIKPPYNIVFMFLNGLPLGLVWGIVFSYLEGRKVTEFLGLMLCTSFIVSSGVVKSAGMAVMKYLDVSEFWMPFVTGLFFLPPLVLFAYLLQKLPEPTEEDLRLRHKREPITKADRKKVFKLFALPLVVLVFFYTLLTAFRDFRDNFSREIWDAVGYKGDVSVYATTEIVIALIVLGSLSLLGFIKENRKAFMWYHVLLFVGVVATGGSTILYMMNAIAPWTWMTLLGLGLYLCYVPFNGIFFDRMIATFSVKGNSGYLIYIADSFGYLGSVLVLFYKNFFQSEISWFKFVVNSSYVLSLVGLVVIIISYIYFNRKTSRELSE
ncbi:hypothetical protein NBRC110019_03400 [Neptunitalea chrysea]|uniref:MFS transporter n=1 Tax=Neptunitalea chrysea TaxID=1647581 RepID=A0A9W6B2Q2_9FLAO|nr:DUF5690 family protein [Neptunitalea chrysea]GLB51301.1 hypothetical protein NBRC110019_03400 [Neptunitalea chrysea]